MPFSAKGNDEGCPDKSRPDERLRHSGTQEPWGSSGAVWGRRKESCTGLNGLGGPRQVRSGQLAREMGQPSSGDSTKLHGEGLDGPVSPTSPTYSCTRIGAPGAAVPRASPWLDPPPRARPGMVCPSILSVPVWTGRRGNWTEIWHWADLVQVIASVGRASQGWLGLCSRWCQGRLCSRQVEPPGPGIWKAFC